MEIKVYRGNQIGGCITEIRTETSRIFVDLGDNLPGNNPLTSIEKNAMVANLLADIQYEHQAVFYTHAHPDHTGMMQYVPANVPQYMSKGTRDILTMINQLLIKGIELQKSNNNLFEEEKEDIDIRERDYRRMSKTLDDVKVWEKPKRGRAPKSITVGNITVTPYFVSHSVYDSHMLLIVADGKRILHTGDYRGHGFLSKGLFPTLRQYIGQVDVLITEGTMLGQEMRCHTEMEISQRMASVMSDFKYVVVMTSATDIERLAAIQNAARKHRRSVLGSSEIVNRAIEYFNKNGKYEGGTLLDMRVGRMSSLLRNDMCERTFRCLTDKGFVLIANPTSLNGVKRFMEKFNAEQTLLIYSCWDGYYKDPDQAIANPIYKTFRDSFTNVVDLHTSGHADADTIIKVIETVNPRDTVICIHHNPQQSLYQLPISEDLKSKIREI